MTGSIVDGARAFTEQSWNSRRSAQMCDVCGSKMTVIRSQRRAEDDRIA